jgi:valyl-tRNA synthetase
MISDYPTVNESLNFPEAERNMEIMLTAIRAIRNRRAEMNVPPKRLANVIIATAEKELFADKEPFFTRLASASGITVVDKCEDEGTVRIVTNACEIFLPLADIVDTEAERERLTKELATAENEIKRAQGKLNNAEFVSKAPEKVVNAEKEKTVIDNEKWDAAEKNLENAMISAGLREAPKTAPLEDAFTNLTKQMNKMLNNVMK